MQSTDSLQIREVLSSDEGAFARWHDAYVRGFAFGREAVLASTLAELTDSLGHPGEHLRRVAVGAFSGETCLGALLLELPLTENLATAWVEINVPPEHRGHGVGGALWIWARERALAEQRTVAQAEVYVPAAETPRTWPGGRFVTTPGCTTENVEDHLVATLPYDGTRLDTIDVHTAAATQAGDYIIDTWVGTCPERWVQAWATLQTAMSVDVPTGGMTREPVVFTPERIQTSEARLHKHWVSLVSLAQTTDGEPVGYSRILLPRSSSEHAYQDDTLVLRAHRGARLGARVKSANLRRLPSVGGVDIEALRWLHTYTEVENHAMQAVKQHFGFRMIEKLHELELSLAELWDPPPPRP